jgi:hypothetical protein
MISTAVSLRLRAPLMGMWCPYCFSLISCMVSPLSIISDPIVEADSILLLCLLL